MFTSAMLNMLNRIILLLLLSLTAFTVPTPSAAAGPVAGRSDWDDVAQAGLQVPHNTLWSHLQFDSVADFLFSDLISNHTRAASDLIRLTLPSGAWIDLKHVQTNAGTYYITLDASQMSSNALLPSFRPTSLLLSLQARPYAGVDGSSVIMTAFRIRSSAPPSDVARAKRVLAALVRTAFDTIRRRHGPYPCMQDYRTYGGTCNNLAHPEWGAYRSPLRRLDDGRMDPSFKEGTNKYVRELPNARTISRKLFRQTESRLSARRVTMLAVFWGQFIDHDLGLTPETGHTVREERMDIAVEDHSDIMYARHNGKIGFTRSEGVRDGRPCCGKGLAERLPREQVNSVSGFLDASHVYGCDRDRVTSLRKRIDGELHMSKRNDGRDMLPTNNGDMIGMKLSNAGPDFDHMFVAGDVRVNEQPVLASLHTLFVREHNRIAKEMRAHLQCKDEERIFQYARKVVSAQIQLITYKFFLPALIGKRHGLDQYDGYHPDINPSISNFFSGAAFRFGHSMVANTLKLLEKRGKRHAKDGIFLHEAFFNPSFFVEVGVETFLLGASHQVAEAADIRVVDSLQNELFKNLTGGIDLVALNIQRGRDHGLPAYNDARQLHGLHRRNSFEDITSDRSVQEELRKVYGSVDRIDPFVGGLAEDPVEDSELGELFTRAVHDQFKRLRDGDRFFFQHLRWPSEIASLESVLEIREHRLTLQDIIVRNSGARLQERDFERNVFLNGS